MPLTHICRHISVNLLQRHRPLKRQKLPDKLIAVKAGRDMQGILAIDILLEGNSTVFLQEAEHFQGAVLGSNVNRQVTTAGLGELLVEIVAVQQMLDDVQVVVLNC